MKIGPCELRNFGPYEHAEFDLSQRGLTGIEGIMHDRPGCTSNGSGKSKLIGGVSWVLFDDPLCDGWSKDDVIRLQFKPAGGNQLEVVTDRDGPVHPREGCSGIVHIVDGEVPIRVERYRGHPKLGNRARLFIDGKDVTRGRDAMTNEAIVEAIGLDFRAFVSSVAFGCREDVKSFFSATDRERKEIFDKLLGLGIYADAQKRARSALRAVAAELEESERKKAAIRGRLQEAEGAQESLVGEDDLEALTFDWRRTRMRRVLAELQAARLSKEVEYVQGELAHEESEADLLVAAHEEAIEAVAQERRRLEHRGRELSELLVGHEADRRSAASELSRWQEMSDTTCGACGQKVARSTALLGQKKALARREKAEQAARELEPAQAELEEALEALSEPEAPRLWMVEAERQALQRAREAFREQDAEVAGLRRDEQAVHRDLKRTERQRETLQARIDELHAELVAAEAADEEKQAEADRLEFWVEGFGPKGIRSFLIESEIPEINRVATRYAQRLLGAGTEVRLAATRQLKTGDTREEMSILAKIPGCTLTYSGASKGQRKRLDLALLLSFREIVSRRFAKNFDQLFADELFDGLDDAGEDSVIELLGEISEECPVTLIAHSDALKSAADRLLVVHHENGVATLETV